MEHKHTPGPWRVDIEQTADFCDGRTETVYELTSADHGITMAYLVSDSSSDTRLIAAAPEMLEALRECIASLVFAADLIEAPAQSAYRENIAMAYAAIAKATQA